ncbi:hypothetical protein C8240_12210, partial [Paracidovorax cattleyae]
MKTATSAAAGPGWRLPGARLPLALAGLVLLADGVWLMAMRQFNLGVALPAVCGAALLALV